MTATGAAFEYLIANPPIVLAGGAADTSLAKLLAPGIAAALIDLAEGRPLLTGQPDVQLIGTYTRERQAHRLLSILRAREAPR